MNHLPLAHPRARTFLCRASASLALLTAAACGTEIGEAVPGEDLDVAQSSRAAIVSNPTTTGWSGRGGSRVVDLDRAVSTNDALVGVTAGERSDDPCYLRALFEDVDGNAASNRTYNHCSGNERSLKTARLPNGYFATGIRTCLNSGRDKVKGIQVIGKPISCLENPSSTVEIENCSYVKINGVEYRLCGTPEYIDVPCSDTRAERSAYFERTNCVGSNNGPDSDWETVRRCPSGKVATSLTLHERDGGGSREMFDGLRLTCNPLQ